MAQFAARPVRRALSFAFGGPSTFAGAGGTPRWISAANRSLFPDNVYTASASQVYHVGDVAFWTGETPVDKLEVVYWNGYLSGIGSETASGAAASYRCRVLDSSGNIVATALSADGQSEKSLASGEQISFFADVSLPANTKYFIRTYAANAAGPQVRSYRVSNTNWGEKCTYTSASATAEAAWSGAPAASDVLTAIGPSAILGRVVGSGTVRCVPIWGDSIASGSVEDARVSDTRGNRGMIKRGLDAASIPMLDFTRPGSTIAGVAGANGALRRALAARLASPIGFVQLMENSLSLGFSSVSAAYATFVDEIKTSVAGIRMIGWHPLVKTTSTDSWATEANQTAGDATLRQQMRDYVDGQVGTRLTGRVNCWPYVRGVDPTKWAINGTPLYATDAGLHPQTVIHIAGMQGIADAITSGIFVKA